MGFVSADVMRRRQSCGDSVKCDAVSLSFDAKIQ